MGEPLKGKVFTIRELYERDDKEDEIKRRTHFAKYGWSTKFIWTKELSFRPTSQDRLSEKDKKFVMERCLL